MNKFIKLTLTLLLLSVAGTLFAQNTNCIPVAHRGFFDKDEPNTLQSFERAMNIGFKWLEIDLRKTTDGVYIMTHEDKVKLYNYNGYPKTFKISETSYEQIKDYYWDNYAKYKITTINEVYQALKGKDVTVILDHKTGSAIELLQIAAEEGFEHQIMLTLRLDPILENADILNQYPFVPIRFYGEPYNAKYTEAVSKIQNPLYMDINIDGDPAYTRKRIAEAVALGIPVSFSGCTLRNKNEWVGQSSFVLANLSKTISHKRFIKELQFESNETVSLNTSVSEINIKVGEELHFKAKSSSSKNAGFVYSNAIDVAPVIAHNLTWGNNVEIYVKGRKPGTTNIRVYTANGTEVLIPVTVSE